MSKYRAYGVVTGGKYLGEVEADSKEEAISKAGELDTCYVSICHQCSSEIDDPDIHEIQVELIKE